MYSIGKRNWFWPYKKEGFDDDGSDNGWQCLVRMDVLFHHCTSAALLLLYYPISIHSFIQLSPIYLTLLLVIQNLTCCWLKVKTVGFLLFQKGVCNDAFVGDRSFLCMPHLLKGTTSQLFSLSLSLPFFSHLNETSP